jgi:serine/threonine protein kinase/TolB-like protein/cytochrome c-type biogenesis protein CcmH/NrfG
MTLSADQMARMSRLLDEALPLDRPGRRQWLDALGVEHRDIAGALERALLETASETAARDPLATLPKILDDAYPAGSHLMPGQLVGPYRLLRLLGHGGMAEVWLAQRADGSLQRDVALKLPRVSQVRPDLAGRFELERNILASLEHPNIARLYDAGDAPDGMPYLSMEYVAGQTITQWCDGHRLGVPERLRLFIEILGAVQYAHERNVIHRDLKPSNILVGEAGRVRLLDFGVARLLGGGAPAGALTREYGRAMTPEYASPESVLGEHGGAAGDIYSLGVVLHELLTGRRPRILPAPTSAGDPLPGIAADAPPPSSTVDADFVSVRGTTRDALARRLRGDLDAIVLKALARRPEDRYASARAFADDLERYLCGAPVSARRGRFAYELSKFLMRHKAESVAAFLALVVLAGLGYEVVHRDRAGESGLAGASVAPDIQSGGVSAVAPDDRSIAVLPFLDLSERHDQEYFSDGLTEELIDRLTRIGNLRVIARTSSFYFKGKQVTVGEIARALHVSHVLEGSVRKAGDAVRITVQLVRAADGAHLWSESYDRNVSNIFRLQDEIAGTVAQALKSTFESGGRPQRVGDVNPDAYNLLLQGNYFIDRNSREDAQKAVDRYTEAIQLDPNFAMAWARLAKARNRQANNGWIPIVEGNAQAREAIARSMALDPNLAFAQYVAGSLEEDFNWDWEAAARHYRRALELDPTNSRIQIALAGIDARHSGRYDPVIEIARRALSRDPLNSLISLELGNALLYAGRVPDADAALRKLLELNPTFAGGQSLLAQCLLLQNRLAEALAAAQREPDESWRLSSLPAIYWALGRKADSDAALAALEGKHAEGFAFEVAEMHAFRGENDAAMSWLERAFRQRDAGLVDLKFDPFLRELRPDPRFQALLRKLNLADAR